MAWARVTWPWLVGTLAVLLLLVAAAPAGAHVHGTQDARRTAASRQVTVVLTLRRGIAWQRSTTLGYQHAMHRWRWPAHYRERTVHSLVRLRHLAAMWNARRQVAYRHYVRWAAAQRQAAAARARAAAAVAAAYPAHHALWLCLLRYEGGTWDNANTGGNGHWGGLQMTPGWMGYFSGTANQYSQAQQEAWAERGYRESGYSSAWLSGQWGQTLGHCV